MPTPDVNSTIPRRKEPKIKKNRQPIKHTKTFSGCWTCRERHVKCDEGKPACSRCLKANVECQGYGIKLVWVDPDTQEREQNIRRAIGTPAVYDDSSSFMRVDVQVALDGLERISISEECPAPECMSLGPFSVFSVQSSKTLSHGCSDASYTLPDAVEDGISSLPEEFFEPSGAISNDEDIESVVSSPLLDVAAPAYDMILAPYSATSNPEYIPYTRHNALTISRHLDLLPHRQDQRQLIHHWTDFVCWHLVPVDQPSNPFRSIFTPMALAGLQTPSSTSNGNIALFHALCSAAAFSRSQLLDGDTNSLTLATKHYQLAIIHLRHSLSTLTSNAESFQSSNDMQRTSILATITMFSAMDMITGRFSEWRTHLQGGASWLATLNSSVWQHDRSSSLVYQGYLAIAALCNINLPANLVVDNDNDELFIDRRHYMLDRFFGLTRPILKHIVVMNSLIRQIASTAGSGSGAAASAKLDELEAQLYEQTPDSLDLSDLAPTAAALTRHHAYVFYYASLIFFARTVRRLRPDSVQIQALVECAVRHLEEIEELGGESVGCTLVWPPFVVASECLSDELQGRMLAWYKVKRRHGFMNLEISKDIAMELWRRRKEYDRLGLSHEVDIQWQDVLKDLQMDIVLA